MASSWGDSWGSSWGSSWGAAVRTDRGGDGFPSKRSKPEKKRVTRNGRVRYFIYADDQIETVTEKPETPSKPVTTPVVEEALEVVAERLGWTLTTAKAALPKVVYFEAPREPDRKELIRALAEILRRTAEAEDEDDIEMLLLAA